ncbi:MAG: MAPEG family protein [Rhodobacterales bacterium]|nr:MAPEG family protein [Rhodobacterales bacterium]
MTTELTILAYAALLQVVHFVIYSIAANLTLGLKVTAGPRDTTPQITGMTGRLQRSFNNHFEALLLFAIAVMVIEFSGQSTELSQTSAILYLVARIAYVPAYLSGIFMLRSLIWFVGLGATVVMLISALF